MFGENTSNLDLGGNEETFRIVTAKEASIESRIFSSTMSKKPQTCLNLAEAFCSKSSSLSDDVGTRRAYGVRGDMNHYLTQSQPFSRESQNLKVKSEDSSDHVFLRISHHKPNDSNSTTCLEMKPIDPANSASIIVYYLPGSFQNNMGVKKQEKENSDTCFSNSLPNYADKYQKPELGLLVPRKEGESQWPNPSSEILGAMRVLNTNASKIRSKLSAALSKSCPLCPPQATFWKMSIQRRNQDKADSGTNFFASSKISDSVIPGSRNPQANLHADVFRKSANQPSSPSDEVDREVSRLARQMHELYEVESNSIEGQSTKNVIHKATEYKIMEKDGIELYTCQKCLFVHPDLTWIVGHCRQHDTEKHAQVLDLYEESLGKKGNYQCELCNCIFVHLKKFRNHMGLHPVEPRKCTVCDKSFTRPSALINHLRIHTGEKPFKCPVCKEAYRTSSGLNIHKKKHIGDTSYSCTICNKIFSFSSQLESHKRVHTGETLYRCDICETYFNSLQYFMRHKRGHSGEKPFKCSICDKAHTSEDHLRKHNRSVHKNESIH